MSTSTHKWVTYSYALLDEGVIPNFRQCAPGSGAGKRSQLNSPAAGVLLPQQFSSPQATRTPIRAIHRARDAATAAQPSVAKPAQSESMYILIFCGSLRTQTRRFLTPPPKSLAGEWPKLFREKNYEKTMTVGNEVICTGQDK